MIAIIISVVAIVLVVLVVIGCIIWSVLSANSAAAAAMRPSVSASPVAVFSKPAGTNRFRPSQSSYNGYSGCYNNGYRGSNCNLYIENV